MIRKPSDQKIEQQIGIPPPGVGIPAVLHAVRLQIMYIRGDHMKKLCSETDGVSPAD